MNNSEYCEYYEYHFTGKTREFEGVLLRQIARSGDNKIGGWIEKRENLIIQYVASPAWIGEDAIVYGGSVVDCAAVVDGDAVVCGSHITGAAHITGCARVEDSLIRGRSRISHQACVKNSIVDDSVIDSRAKVENAELKFCVFTGWADVKGKHRNRRYDGQYWLR